MPRKKRKATETAVAALAAMPQIAKELIDQCVTGLVSAEAVNAALREARGGEQSPQRRQR